jgi:hypothetical protein
MTQNYISGLAFHQIANWSLCPRYQINFEPNKFKENDIVFLNLDFFNEFISIIAEIPPKVKFILITHNSDKCFTENHYILIKDIINKIYAINTIFNNENVITIPIGFRDMPLNTIPIIKSCNKIFKKEILIYMNFEIITNIKKRITCFNYFINFNWITSKSKLSIEDFYNDIKKSKYILSPEGTGIDCHRIYESIYFDAIPIVKSSSMNNFYKDLPVIIIKEWSDITEEFLISNYDRYYKNLILWKLENNNWLDPIFWLK